LKMEKPAEVSLLCMKNISVKFGSITALDGVDFSVGENEVVGLLGSNGVGKSTLIKTLIGFHKPSSGEVYFEGEKIYFDSTWYARSKGIETVFQDFSLAENLSIYQNFFIGRELLLVNKFFKFQNRKKMHHIAEKYLREIGLTRNIKLDEKVSLLSGGERQLLSIGRACYFVEKLLILDEPFSALSESSVQKVLRAIENVKKRGISIIFVTHHAPEVFEIADRFVILENGRNYANLKKEDTDIKELEKLLISSRLTVVKEMAAGIAHQIRNPLGIMKVSADVLKRKVSSYNKHKDEVEKIINVLSNEINTLNHIIENFLDFAHQRKLMKSNYSVKKLIEQSLESLPIYKYPDIVISLKIQNYLRDFEIDVNLMKQAIKNLIMNSIEASNGFGRIEIRAYMKRELLIIEIQDWGCGMDEETKRQIFNPFFTTKTSGTGLGLSIVHRVIDQHQGKIEVESYPSRGTMFRIIL